MHAGGGQLQQVVRQWGHHFAPRVAWQATTANSHCVVGKPKWGKGNWCHCWPVLGGHGACTPILPFVVPWGRCVCGSTSGGGWGNYEGATLWGGWHRAQVGSCSLGHAVCENMNVQNKN